MIIRPETAGDAAEIRQVVTAAFATAPHSSGTEAAIVEALRSAGALSLSLIAEDDGEVIGHIAFSPVQIDGREDGWLGLGPVAVRPDRQQRGIGAALINEGLARLRAEGAKGCVLLGDPDYYRRFGFVSDDHLRYGDVPPGYFQWLSFTDTRPYGEVQYHPGFAASDDTPR
ncbi:N-acetyltransferase [Sphingomonas sp. C3-2]|uniref:GNAT family N-acetyltransferase n=1 Tax=Sphingomonas sp. C3-2 TaxID=3062169 RepID=UPI00294B10E8|nr:N-acetyltransferase [Sphingomonas sp. C3-2]WOK35834.1 N-acetyltransferase [Sphingomonas sp. C3-2]